MSHGNARRRSHRRRISSDRVRSSRARSGTRLAIAAHGRHRRPHRPVPAKSGGPRRARLSGVGRWVWAPMNRDPSRGSSGVHGDEPADGHGPAAVAVSDSSTARNRRSDPACGNGTSRNGAAMVRPWASPFWAKRREMGGPNSSCIRRPLASIAFSEQRNIRLRITCYAGRARASSSRARVLVFRLRYNRMSIESRPNPGGAHHDERREFH